jgi:hypothetical protein
MTGRRRCPGFIMKATLFSLLLVLFFVTGCRQLGVGTPGHAVEMGIDHAEGSTPYAVGRTSPFMRAGMPDVNVAASRAEAGLATSPSGRAELSRRSAAATVRSPWAPDLTLEPEVRSLDEIILGRIELALSAAPAGSPDDAADLTIKSWHNLQISSRDGFVTLRGRVGSEDEKREIQEIVSRVEGVRGVWNGLEAAAPGLPGEP